MAHLAREVDAALDDFGPVRLAEVGQVRLADAFPQEPEEDARVEIVAGADGAPGLDRLRGVMRLETAGEEVDAILPAGGDEIVAIELDVLLVDRSRLLFPEDVDEILVRSPDDVRELEVLEDRRLELDRLVRVGFPEVGVVVEDRAPLLGVSQELDHALAERRVERVVGAVDEDVVFLDRGQRHVEPLGGIVLVERIVRVVVLVEEGERDGALAVHIAVDVVGRDVVLLHEGVDEAAHVVVAQLADEQDRQAHAPQRGEAVEHRAARDGGIGLVVAEDDVEDGLADADDFSHTFAVFVGRLLLFVLGLLAAFRAKVTAVVPLGVFRVAELDAPHGADDQDVADDGHHRRRGGRRQPQRADLFRVAGEEADVGLMRQRAVGVAGDHDETHVGHQAAGQRDQLHQLAGLARVGDEQQQVLVADDAQVAVLRLAGMQEEGRRPGRAEGGGDVHGDLSGLAHAARDQPAAPVMDMLDDQRDGLVESGSHRDVADGVRLVLQYGNDVLVGHDMFFYVFFRESMDICQDLRYDALFLSLQDLAELRLGVPARVVVPLGQPVAQLEEEAHLLEQAAVVVALRMGLVGRLMVGVGPIVLDARGRPGLPVLPVVVPPLGEHGGDAAPHEGQVVGAVEHAVRRVGVGHDVAALLSGDDGDERVEVRLPVAGDRHVVVLAPERHHVHVDHGGHLLDREERVGHVILGAEQAALLAGGRQEDDVPSRLHVERLEAAGDLEHPGDGHGVVGRPVDDRVAVDGRAMAEVVPVAEVDDALVGRLAAGDVADQVGALVALEAVRHRDAHGRGQLEGPEVGPPGDGAQLVEVITVVGQQPAGGLLLDPAVERAMVVVVAVVDIHLRLGGGLHDRPGIAGAPRVVDDERPFQPLAGGLLELIAPAAVVGHDVAAEIVRVAPVEARVVDEDHRHLVAGVLDARVVVLPVFRGDDAIAGEHQLGVVDLDRRLDAGGEGGEVLQLAEARRPFRGLERHLGRGLRTGRDQLDRLQVGVAVEGRQAERAHLAGDVADRPVCARREGLAPLARVVGDGLGVLPQPFGGGEPRRLVDRRFATAGAKQQKH